MGPLPEVAVPELEPHLALRYGPRAGSLSDLLAPPYDVIDPPLAEALRARSPWNAVRLVLPEGEPPDRYELAAARLAAWGREGVLQADAVPAVTVYRQSFDAPEGRLTRHALFAALRLEPPGAGVLPHERTHSGPKRDRLALTLATRTQLSPVFLAARDPDGDLLSSLLESAAEADESVVTPDGIEHRIRRMDDPVAAGHLCALAGAGSLLIADGHHRYETALEVARLLADELPAAGLVLACIVSERDPGLRVRPTHRVLRGPPPDWVSRLEPAFGSRELPGCSAEAAAAHAELSGAIVLRVDGRSRELSPRSEALAAGGLDEADAAIPAVLLDRLVVEGVLGQEADGAARDGLLTYHRDATGAAEAAGLAGPGTAVFLLPSVPLEAVWRVTELGRRLPPKSTYFEPKVPSGLLFRPLDPG
jgi:uncharacterized protein (DUF1015 family)